MKKVVCMTAVLCLTSPLFAQIGLGGWGRIVWMPYYSAQDGDARSVMQAPWGEDPGFEFYINARTENIGVDAGLILMRGDAESQSGRTFGIISQIANAKAWWSPNRYFKLHLGSGRVQELRGKIYGSTGAYAYARGRHFGITTQSGDNEPVVRIDDGDGIFSRFNLSSLGAIAEIKPLPDLYIGAALMPEWKDNAGNLFKDVYKGIHAAAGYNVRGIGLARIAYVGGGAGRKALIANTARNNDFSWDRRIEAAMSLINIPNTLMDIGLKYSLERHPGCLELGGFSLENPLYIAVGAVYTGIDKLRIGLALDGHFAGTSKIANGDALDSAPQIAFNLYPTYNIGFLDIGADITFGAQFGKDTGSNDKKLFGFGFHAQKTYGSGSFRAGIYVTAPMFTDQKWGVGIPVWITYSF